MEQTGYGIMCYGNFIARMGLKGVKEQPYLLYLKKAQNIHICENHHISLL